MGSCSNREETQSEKVARFAKEIYEGDISTSNWQSSKGAKIRRNLGIEKGNKFIKEISKIK